VEVSDGFRIRPKSGFYEHGNEPLGSIKGNNSFNSLLSQLLKEDFVL
jgi:hypothetical protein